jgi:hypothetical protein
MPQALLNSLFSVNDRELMSFVQIDSARLGSSVRREGTTRSVPELERPTHIRARIKNSLPPRTPQT